MPPRRKQEEQCGAGKSTLLKIISGNITPTEGTVDVAGRVKDFESLANGLQNALESVGIATSDAPDDLARLERGVRKLAGGYNAAKQAMENLENRLAAADEGRTHLEAALEPLQKAYNDLDSQLKEQTAYLEKPDRNHKVLQAVYDRTLVRRVRLMILRLGKNRCEPSVSFFDRILGLAEPSIVDAKWNEARAAGGRTFLMITHDQDIDRCIIQGVA